jgi:hypothetical protein
VSFSRYAASLKLAQASTLLPHELANVRVRIAEEANNRYFIFLVLKFWSNLEFFLSLRNNFSNAAI